MNVRCQHPSHFGKAPYEPLGILSCRLAAGSSLYPLLHILISEKHTRLYLLRQDIAQLLQCHPKMKSECLAWSMGWKLNQWARLQDGNHAYKLYGNLLKNGTLDNLWDTHAPFQIDGNFGGTAGITEMLLQSHMGFIQLLPALPDAWANGSISGICAKGNFEVSISWKEGQLEKAIIHSKSGIPCNVRYGDKTLKFKTVKGKKYEITLKGDKLAVL